MNSDFELMVNASENVWRGKMNLFVQSNVRVINVMKKTNWIFCDSRKNRKR